MGLAEQRRAGADLSRNTTLFTNVVGSGSVDLNASYAILSIQTTTPCRLRLYENQTSLNDSGELTRSFGDTNIASNVALVGDFSMSAPGKYTTDPVLYGLSEDSTNTFYRVEPNLPATITLNTYTLEDSAVPVGGLIYTINNRRTIPGVSASLAPTSKVTGSINSSITIPKTYMIVSASFESNEAEARIRFYSDPSALNNPTEVSRSFGVEPPSASYLLLDVAFTGSDLHYFKPKIIGANLSTMGNNLRTIVTNRTAIEGTSGIYYILENIDAVTTTSATASFHVYSLED